MTAADVPLGLHFSEAAGWNQLEADWRRALDLQSDGCFVAEQDGIPVGTTTTCILGRVAWIALVLVQESVRGQGIGKALMKHALDFLDQRQVASVRLDATPLGQPLYERLGFVEQFRLARYEGTLPTAPHVFGAEETVSADWEALAALDEQATGTDRRALLLRLFAEQPAGVRRMGDRERPRGFVALRAGRKSLQIGPCVADAESGPLLFADAWHRLAGRRVYVDIPLTNEPALRLAESQGLTVQRHLTRMCRGVPVCERLEWLWASSGPEKG
jgi:GNAT superfamily N-acetyltransferase